MSRTLDTATLEQAARDYAGFFMLPDSRTKGGQNWATGPERVKQDFFNFDFKDEFDFVLQMIRDELGKNSRARFDEMAKAHFKARDKKVFEKTLVDKLAITPNGDHIEGKIGAVQIARRVIARRMIVRRKPIARPVDPSNPAGEWQIVRYRDVPVHVRDEWPVYAGEGDERIRPGGGAADPIPEGAEGLAVGANVTNISAESCILGIDAIADALDEGTTAANIRGRTGSQPVDPDATETGTLLFTLACSDPAVNAGVDDTDGTCSATFDTITDDSSADATGTLGYCRVAATGTGADDHIDGNAATSAAAFVFNTVSIVSGSTVSMTSAVLGQSQGSTAT